MPSRRPLFHPDAGWLFLLAGLGTLGATVIIPAQHDLEVALWHRDCALAVEASREARIKNYGTYLRSLDQGEESVVLSLASMQLNKSPLDRVPLNPRPDPANVSASVFPALEPPDPAFPPKPVVTERSSILARWTIDDHTRLWLLASGVLCCLVGVLPPSSRPKLTKA